MQGAASFIAPSVSTSSACHGGLPFRTMIEIARAQPERFIFGTLDYLKNTATRHTKEVLLFARSLLVNVSRAAELEPPIGGVSPYLEDEAGLLEEARHERALDFAGKTFLHPKQITRSGESSPPPRKS